MYQEAIGIIGVGSVSTLDFFRRIVEAFPGEKEWDRPRIFIDNDCTMPSRDRAVLFNENVDKLKSILKNNVQQMYQRMKNSNSEGGGNYYSLRHGFLLDRRTPFSRARGEYFRFK